MVTRKGEGTQWDLLTVCGALPFSPLPLSSPLCLCRPGGCTTCHVTARVMWTRGLLPSWPYCKQALKQMCSSITSRPPPPYFQLATYSLAVLRMCPRFAFLSVWQDWRTICKNCASPHTHNAQGTHMDIRGASYCAKGFSPSSSNTAGFLATAGDLGTTGGA